MKRRKASDYGHIDRRSFLYGTGRFAVGALTVSAILRPNHAWGQRWRR